MISNSNLTVRPIKNIFYRKFLSGVTIFKIYLKKLYLKLYRYNVILIQELKLK